MIELNRIYNEDCLETMRRMEDNSIDLIVTDPPYGLNYNNGDLAHNREKVFGGKVERMEARPIANDGEEEAYKLFRAMLKEARRVLKPGSCCCCCCCGGGPKPLFARWTLWMDEVLDFKQAIVWDKGGLGMGIHYRRNYEFLLIATKPGAAITWNGGNATPNLWRIPKIIPSQKEHPTAKPEELMAKAIHLHSDEGGIVYDPFVGHGPTLVAAERLNRQWIGSEINPDYCKIAQRRIDEERAQLKLAI